MLEDERDPFAVSDFEKVNLAGLHTLLMQLSEVYLAYDTVSSSRTDAPNFVLLDQSISSAMAANMIQPSTVRLIGSHWGTRCLTEADVVVALAHPFNRDLEIPTVKQFRQYTGLIARMQQNEGKVNLEELAYKEGLELSDLRSGIKYLTERNLAKLENSNKQLIWTGTENIDNIWAYTKTVFQQICEKLFIEKDPTALTYVIERDGLQKQYWMSPSDLKFLIGLGLRMLIEKCWERKVLLVGLVKDSSSAYFTRNYLGVMRHLKIFPNLNSFSRPLPSTDRIALELLPLIDDEIESPWSTVEFDAVFMTMFVRRILW